MAQLAFEEMKQAWEVLPVACLAFQRRSEIVYANQAAVEMLGAQESQEVCSEQVTDLLPGVAEALAACGAQASPTLQVQARRLKDGLPIWLDIALVKLPGSEITLGTLHDISEYKKLEGEKRISDTYFRTIFDSAGVGIGIDDLEGRTIFCNPALERILGYSQEELRAMVHTEFSYPEDLADEASLYQALLDGREDTIRYLKRYVRKDGELIWGNLTLSLLHEVDKKPEHIIVMLEDITGRKKMELDLLDYSQRLEAMHDLDQAILEAQSPINIVCAALEKIDQVIPSQRFSVVIFDANAKNREALLILREDGKTKIGESRQIFMSDFDIPRLQNGEIRLVQDLNLVLEKNLLEQTYSQQGMRAYALLPLINQNELVGLLTLSVPVPDSITNEMITKGWEVAHLLALAIQQSRLFEQTERRARELEVIAQLSLELRRAETRQVILDTIFELSVKTLQADLGGLLLLEPEGLRFTHAHGYPENVLGEVIPEMRIPFWHVIRTGKALYLVDEKPEDNSPEKSPLPERYRPLHKGYILAALIPIRSSDKPIGLLHLSYRDRTEFTIYDQRLFTTLADIASNALERAEVFETLEKQVYDRTWELETLYEVSSAASGPEPLEKVLSRTLAKILDKIGCPAGLLLWLDEKTSQVQIAAAKGLSDDERCIPKLLPIQHPSIQKMMKIQKPAWISASTLCEVQPRAGLDTACLCVPFHRGLEIGGWMLLFDVNSCIGERELKVLGPLGDQVGIALERHTLREEANETLIMKERQRLARDLHDSVTQLIYSQALSGEAGRKYLAAEKPDQAANCLNELVQNAHQALKELRLMIYELRPSVLKEEGFIGALQYRLGTVEKRAGVKATLTETVKRRLNPFEEENLYRIVQEALNNSLKHANATEVEIHFYADEEMIELEVSDNGSGFDTSNSGTGLGLDSIRERVAEIGGQVSIDSCQSCGTSIKVWVEKSSEGSL